MFQYKIKAAFTILVLAILAGVIYICIVMYGKFLTPKVITKDMCLAASQPLIMSSDNTATQLLRVFDSSELFAPELLMKLADGNIGIDYTSEELEKTVNEKRKAWLKELTVFLDEGDIPIYDIQTMHPDKVIYSADVYIDSSTRCALIQYSIDVDSYNHSPDQTNVWLEFDKQGRVSYYQTTVTSYYIGW